MKTWDRDLPPGGPGWQPQVALTDEEMEAARQHAIRVESNAARHGLRHKFINPYETPTEWATRGYAAEMAVAKHIGVKWEGWLWDRSSSTKTVKKGDVAGIEVRNAKRPDGYLYVYENDPDDRPVLLTTGTGPVFTLVGWLYAAEARRHGIFDITQSGKGQWRCPQAWLRSIATLPVEEAA